MQTLGKLIADSLEKNTWPTAAELQTTMQAQADAEGWPVTVLVQGATVEKPRFTFYGFFLDTPDDKTWFIAPNQNWEGLTDTSLKLKLICELSDEPGVNIPENQLAPEPGNTVFTVDNKLVNILAVEQI